MSCIPEARELGINNSSTLRAACRSRDPLICLATVHDPTDVVRFRRDYHILSHIMAGFFDDNSRLGL